MDRAAGKRTLRRNVPIFLLFAGLWAMLPRVANGAQVYPSDAKSVPIYVSDFELSAAPGTRPAAKPTADTSKKKPADTIYPETEPASVQAKRVVDAFSALLTDAFRKNGYAVTRLTGSLPTSGVLLRGIFGEADQQNRVRRAILGAGAPGPTFTLYVGAFNLGRPDQPLYAPAPVQDESPQYGPVITLNAYLPMMRFELPKDPSEQDVRKICGQIVDQLTKLLVENPNAMSH